MWLWSSSFDVFDSFLRSSKYKVTLPESAWSLILFVASTNNHFLLSSQSSQSSHPYDLCIQQRSWVERRMLALLPLALSSQSAAWFNYWICGRNNMKWKRIADDCCIFPHKRGTDSIPNQTSFVSQVRQVLFAEIGADCNISTSGCGLWESDFLGQRTENSWTPTSRHVTWVTCVIGICVLYLGLDVYGP